MPSYSILKNVSQIRYTFFLLLLNAPLPLYPTGLCHLTLECPPALMVFDRMSSGGRGLTSLREVIPKVIASEAPLTRAVLLKWHCPGKRGK